MRTNLIGAIMIVGLSSCTTPTDKSSILTQRIADAETQLTELRDYSLKNNRIPRTTNEAGSVKWIFEGYDWTEGFWPGTCWMMFENTNDEAWKNSAIKMQDLYLHHKDLTNDHDLGFIFNNSFGKAYKLTGDEKYLNVIIDASESLITRFNDTVGCIQSWDCVDNWQSKRGWRFPVIVDNMMNLEMLFDVADYTGDNKFREVAIAHANTSMKYHFRDDASSYHVVDYDPSTGKVRSQETAQGYADESAWARGQAWGLYGYTMCYRYTKDQTYLDFAERIAEFILSHPNMTEDGVPYWDYNASQIPSEPRDASAAAIMASAFVELSSYTDGKYMDNANHILESLATEKYTAKNGENGNFVLMHSVGSIPHGNEIDVHLNYADYYYIEAMMKYRDALK